MTKIVVLHKQTTGYYTGRVRANNVDLGSNLLIGNRRTKIIDEARNHCQGQLTDEFSSFGVRPTIVFEIADPAERQPRKSAHRAQTSSFDDLVSSA